MIVTPNIKRKRSTAHIYAIINIAENKMYIGCTINIKARISQHRRKLITGTHENKLMLADFKRLGHEYFKAELLETVTQDSKLTAITKGRRTETKYIYKLNPYYNIHKN